MKIFHAITALTVAIGTACLAAVSHADPIGTSGLLAHCSTDRRSPGDSCVDYMESALVSTRELLAHCSADHGAPDNYCIGYMDAALDFITNYQVWLSLNRYDFPPGEKLSCPVDAHGRDVTAVELINVLRDYVGKKGQNTLTEPGMRVLPKALAEAFACPAPK